MITKEIFATLRQTYQQSYPVMFGCVDQYGQALYGNLPQAGIRFQDACLFAVQEAFRWGDPSMSLFEDRYLLWGIPLMHNEQIEGGLVACSPEKSFYLKKADTENPAEGLRGACDGLRKLAEEHNVTNKSALTLQRRKYESEQKRAYAIHDIKQNSHATVLELYLREEPALFSAIRAGNRRKARYILNKILVAIHYYAGNSIPLIKGFFMELVAGMFRTAVDAGGKPEELLGHNFMIMVRLSEAENENELAAWLRETLEGLMTVIQKSYDRGADSRLLTAMEYMKNNCCKLPSREEVAQAAGLSPSYFSSLIKQHTDATFTQLLNQMRADEAAILIRKTSKPLAQIAFRTGFSDQSYFTKIFKRYQGQTPREYHVTHGTGKDGT